MNQKLQNEISEESVKSGISEAMAWHVVMARAMRDGRIDVFGAPDQPRDENGRWTDGSGGSMSWAAGNGKDITHKNGVLSVPGKTGNRSYFLTDVRAPNDTEAAQLTKAGYDPAKYIVSAGPIEGTKSFHPIEHKPQLTEALRRTKEMESASAKKSAGAIPVASSAPSASAPTPPTGSLHEQYKTLRENDSNNYDPAAFPGSRKWTAHQPHAAALREFEAKNPDVVRQHQAYLDAKRTHELMNVNPWTN